MTATRTVDLDNLLGLAEIASEFDVPYSTALSWTRSRGFPAPVKVFKMGCAWLRSDITEWLKTPNTRRRVR
jgi:predicted DNA-binding transcriptional regulator AlpA